ncbi:hypothetical protein ACQPTN_06430 [Bradyrhizobium sp. 13971]
MTRSPPFKELIAAELARIESQLVDARDGSEQALERKLRRYNIVFNVDSWRRPPERLIEGDNSRR